MNRDRHGTLHRDWLRKIGFGVSPARSSEDDWKGYVLPESNLPVEDMRSTPKKTGVDDMLVGDEAYVGDFRA